MIHTFTIIDLQEMIIEIDNYYLKSAQKEYTDTGIIWELIIKWREKLNAGLPKKLQTSLPNIDDDEVSNDILQVLLPKRVLIWNAEISERLPYLMEVCCVSDATDEEILETCNRENRTNTWVRVIRLKKEYLEHAPKKCPDIENRIHYAVIGT